MKNFRLLGVCGVGFLSLLAICDQAIGGGLYFADGQFAKIPDSPVMRPTEFTIELWFKAFSRSSLNHLIAKPVGTSVSDSYWIALAGCRMGLVEADPQAGVNGYQLNKWHHVALTTKTVVNGASDRRLFLDGNEIDNWLYDPPYGYDSSPVFLGADDNDHDGIGGFTFVGLIDEVRIWNYPRTGTEIQSTMGTELWGSESGLLNYWRLNEGYGQTIHDVTANASHGFLGYDSLPGGDLYEPLWASEGAPITPIPEPATLSLLAVGVLAVVRRRRRGRAVLPGLLVAVAAAVLLAAISLQTASAVTYTVTDLGTFGGEHGAAYDINQAGQVVGYAYNSSGMIRPFVWSKALGMSELPLLPGTNDGEAFAINDLGWAVGMCRERGSQWQPTIWRPGQNPVVLSTLPGFTETYPRDINEQGQIVGEIRRLVNGDYVRHPFLWTEDNGMVDLGTLGGSEAWAKAINNVGKIVGGSELGGSHPRGHAFSCTGPGDMTDIYPDFPTRDYVAMGINSHGAIVGQAYKADGTAVPALWVNGTGEPVFAAIPYGWASDISDTGVIVGQFCKTTAFTIPFGFIWDGGDSFVTLPGLDAGNDWYTHAEAVNNTGWIVGTSRNAAGYEHPVIWTPEPATLSLLALGVLPLIRRRESR